MVILCHSGCIVCLFCGCIEVALRLFCCYILWIVGGGPRLDDSSTKRFRDRLMALRDPHAQQLTLYIVIVG